MKKALSGFSYFRMCSNFPLSGIVLITSRLGMDALSKETKHVNGSFNASMTVSLNNGVACSAFTMIAGWNISDCLPSM